MVDYMDFFNEYIMGNAQVLTGFYFLTRFLKKKVKFYFYILFAFFWTVFTAVFSTGRMEEFLIYIVLLAVNGIFVCHVDWKSVILSSVLTVEIMQLCFGIVNSLLSILYPMTVSFDQNVAGIVFMLVGYTAAFLLAALCYYITYRYFSCYETAKKQYVLMVLMPVLMFFFVGEYFNSIFYSNIRNDGGMLVYSANYWMLVIQILGIASLFCILFAHKKLLQNFQLSTELSLLEQEEHSFSQYVEEARDHYEKTKSFRHDIKNHIEVVKGLLQNGQLEQALDYIGDMEDITGELSAPCSTNNPVVDILMGNKMGIAKSMQIDVSCFLNLPYPCSVRDIDFGIILSNAMDNAIHACKNMDSDVQKYIRVTGHKQGDFILLEIENSFQGKRTFKKGIGLSNINTIAEKYHGAMSVNIQDTSFILSVLLIIPQQSESISQQIG